MTGFDSLAKINFSLARRRHLLLWREQVCFEWTTVKYKVFPPFILTEPPSKLRNWRRRKSFFSFKIPTYNFHPQNNLFHLNSMIRCKHSHRCYNYRHRSTTKSQVFASVRNSHRTSQPAAEKHSVLPKTDNSRFLTNTIIRSTLTPYVANIAIDVIIIAIAQWNAKFFASVRNSHRTSQLAAEKHSFLLKCQFKISCEHNHSFHLNFIYMYKLQT